LKHGQNLHIFDGIVGGKLLDPLLVDKKNLTELLRRLIRKLNRVNWVLNYHVVKPKPSQNLITTTASVRVMVLGKGAIESAAESRVEILDDPDLPGRAGARRDPEDLRGALVLVAEAEWALLLLFGLGGG
jgi:hypothetical protein